MAALLEALALSGHRKSNGSANASGRAWVYEHGTTTAATVYSDADETSVLSNPVTLDGAGKARIFVVGSVDIRFEDSTGALVEQLTFSERADRVEVRNLGFTGTLASGSLGAGGATDLDTVLTSLFASVGGLDGQYKEFTGATSRSIQGFLRDIWVSVKDWGAVGNGIADDTTKIQAAINEVTRLGGGVVYFPPGTYKISSVLINTTAFGASFVGAGSQASTIKNSNAATGIFTVSSVQVPFAIRDLAFSHSSSSTAAAITVTLPGGVRISGVSISGHRYGIDLADTGAASAGRVEVYNSVVNAAVGDAAARSLRMTGSFSTGLSFAGSAFVGCDFEGSSGDGVELAGDVTGISFIGCVLAGAIGLNLNSVTSTNRIAAFGCTFTGATDAISVTGTEPIFVQQGNGVDGYTVNVATGGNHTPDMTRGREIRIRANSGGAGIVTVNAATPTPGSTVRDCLLIFKLVAAAGGNVTNRFDASYVLVGGSTDIVVADTNTSTVTFRWDADGSKWRESTTRALTAT